jgi:c(7)-type cytochrome triheme protein
MIEYRQEGALSIKRIFCVVFLIVLFSVAAASAFEIVPPETYGRVIINTYSKKAGLAPVVFDHWLHRAKYTCRLCHVDIGFVMEAGASKINAAANMKGFYCGACHNGERLYEEDIRILCREIYSGGNIAL